MAKFCLTKDFVNKFLKGLQSGEISPEKMSVMASLERRTYLEKFVGAENAQNVNALFESKMLLKNQEQGYISWAKKVSGITPEVRRDMIKRIENLQEVLDPKAEDKFLQDLASTRLGVNITQEEAKTLAELSKAVEDAKAKVKPDFTFNSKEERLTFGSAQVNLENYFNELKLVSKEVSFKEHPVKKIVGFIKETPGMMKSIVASLDNSFFGRQGIKTLYTHPSVWARAFGNSWKDIAKQTFAKGKWYKSGDNAVMDSLKADIYSRPNALNGKYRVGKYNIDVLSEEAYPSSIPEKIPLFGRLFKASEVAYNGAALRMRADLADIFIKGAEDMGMNMLDPVQAIGVGRVIGSLTGRGSLSLTEGQAKGANVLFFSIKFLKGNFDILTMHLLDPKVRENPYARKQAGLNLLKIIATVAFLLTTAKILDPNSVDEDPRSTNFGKIKIWGHWVDITGGMGSLVTLASRLIPTEHNGTWGFWEKTTTGKYIDLGTKYGVPNPLDLLESFFEGKLSPSSGILRDIWSRKTYTGQPVTIQTELFNQVPMSVGLFTNLMQDPASTFVLGSLILDALGFSTSSTVAPNSQTKLLPEGKPITNGNLINGILIYANAIGTDPETAFNRIFTGQTIRKVTNGTVIVERMPLNLSQAEKKRRNANNPQMKLDHTIPLELGGSNDANNLKIVTTSQWRSYTPIENALGQALNNGKITKTEAQRLIVEFKKGNVSSKSILDKYK